MAERSTVQKVSSVGIQVTLVGLAGIQIGTLENGPFTLFLIGVALVVLGTAITFAGAAIDRE